VEVLLFAASTRSISKVLFLLAVFDKAKEKNSFHVLMPFAPVSFPPMEPA
jgi:hypothetical protein